MSRLVVHVDTAATWRGGQNQVLLTAQGMAARGVPTEIACRAGGALEARARAAGIAVQAVSFRGDLWPPGILALAHRLRREPRSVLLLHDPHAVSAGLAATRLGPRVPLVAVRRVDFPAARRAVAGEVRPVRPGDRREPRDPLGGGGGRNRE